MDENEQKLHEALNLSAAETLRADEAETKLKELNEKSETMAGEITALTARLDEADKREPEIDTDKLQRQNVALQAQLTAQRNRADAAENPDKIRKLVAVRVGLEAQAKIVMGPDFKAEDMTDRQVMSAVIERLDAKVADDATDAFVSGCFTTLIKGHVAGSAALERVRETVQTRTDEADKARRNDNRSARDKFLDSQMNAAFQKEA